MLKRGITWVVIGLCVPPWYRRAPSSQQATLRRLPPSSNKLAQAVTASTATAPAPHFQSWRRKYHNICENSLPTSNPGRARTPSCPVWPPASHPGRWTPWLPTSARRRLSKRGRYPFSFFGRPRGLYCNAFPVIFSSLRTNFSEPHGRPFSTLRRNTSSFSGSSPSANQADQSPMPSN